MRVRGQRDLAPEFVTIFFMQEAGPRRRIALPRHTLVVLAVALIFAAVFFRVWQEMQVLRLGYQVSALRQTRDQLLNEQRHLLAQRNQLANLSRVEALARTRLQMQTPEPGQVIFLPEETKAASVWGGADGWQRWLSVWSALRVPVLKEGQGGSPIR